MKMKIKQFFSKNLVGFLIGCFVCGIISVYAVTYFPSMDTLYDNSKSGMQSTNVQDAIDELYNSCFPSFTIGGKPVKPVTSGDGLYEDEYEDGKYTYKGANPNNYIKFNNELWRIISVDSDGIIKIMRAQSIGDQSWERSESKEWATASLNTYFNGTYYNSLTSTAKSQIVSRDFSVGKIPRTNNDLNNQINLENSAKWNGKIALPTASEYLRANSNKSACETMTLFNNNDICKNTNLMFTSNYQWWTITPRIDRSNTAYRINSDGHISDGANIATNRYDIRPAIYISSRTKLISGTGTQSNPYTIE